MARGRPGARFATLLLGTISAVAFTASATAQSARPSLNFYGNPGLIDLPSAESMPDGQISLSYSYFGGNTRRNFNFQVLPRVSGTLRYSTIENWRGRPDPNFDLYDRSFDVKFQILKDRGRWQPSLALGFRDILGTGVYSAEYLAASKRVTPDLIVTGGIGWGRLGSVNGFENPFCAIDDFMCDRDEDFGEGGQVEYERWFRGETAALFGGVEWRTPVDGLTFKAEYSSDAYTEEQEGEESVFDRKSPFNFGLEYNPAGGIQLGAYYMYGSAVGFNLALTGNPNRPLTPQNLGTGPLPVNPRAADAPQGTAWVNDPGARDRLSAALAEALDAEGIHLDEVRFESSASIEVLVENRRYNQPPKAIGRTARVLAVGMPASVETFGITIVDEGLPVTQVTIDRSQYEDQVDRFDAGLESWETVELTGAEASAGGAALWRRPGLYPEFSWSIVPAPYLYLLEPDDPIRLGLNLDFNGTVQLSRGLSVTGSVSQPLINSADDPGPSETELQPVRSDTPRYYATYTPKLAQLTTDYLFKLNPNTYGRATAGYMERMFAGVGGEVLWQPPNQSWGVGADLNWVAQRNFDNLGFGHYDYDVVTGHASFYWETGYEGLEVQLDAGRYLAGDWGGTVTVTRTFANGWAVGAYATKTDVTSEDFGEGSFDKGITISIPFRWTVPFETQATNDLSLTSISRDGGAKLNISNRLYPIVSRYDRYQLERNWGAFWQ